MFSFIRKSSFRNRQFSDFIFIILLLINLYATETPKRCPINAVTPIATVPQKQILNTAIPIFEPPVFAEIAPKIIRKIIEKPYWK